MNALAVLPLFDVFLSVLFLLVNNLLLDHVDVHLHEAILVCELEAVADKVNEDLRDASFISYNSP